MSAQDSPAVSRRGVLAGVAAVSAAGLTASCTASGRPATAGLPLADAVLAAFRTHRLVGLGEIHDLQNHGDALALLLSDPRLARVVDDVVVEFGNALYQDTIDAFIAGQPVSDADLRLVWRNTTQSPLETWDPPIYEQVYRTVRAANWAQPPAGRMRVLAGDPPLDWTAITTRREYLRAQRQHGGHGPGFWVPLVQKEVLARGRRALLCFGDDTFIGVNAAVGGERIYRVVDLVPPATDPGGLASRLSRYPRLTVIPTAGTWLGSADAEAALAAGPSPPGPGLASAAPPVPGPKGRHPTRSVGDNFCGQRTGSLIEAGLYLGQPGEVTASWPNPAIYLDPVYWAELQRRNALSFGLDLSWLRREHPARLPQRTPPACGPTARASH